MSLSVVPNPRVAFKVIYEDDELIVVDKPARLATQPGKGHDTDTLLNGLFERFGHTLQNLGAARDYGLLHRLDRSTSGLLVVALRGKAYDGLRTAFETREVGKFYWAICGKGPRPPRKLTGVINKPILETEPRAGTPEKRVARIHTGGKPSATAYRVLSESAKGALIEARPVTGRLHQVRVHLDAIGCTVLGDDLYGPRSYRLAATRLALHAHRLTFTHPTTGAAMDVRSPFPKELRAVLTRLGLERPDEAEADAG
ncbi:MAG: RluA family pseudouridine synthase [Phycisphaerales bacterium]